MHSPHAARWFRTQNARGNTRIAAKLVLWVIAILAGINGVHAQSTIDIRREYNVKAVNVYGFCRFVTWPETAFEAPESDLYVGIYGKSRIEPTLMAIAKKKTVDRRRMRIITCESVDDLKKCHIVFVSKSVAAEEFSDLIKATERDPVVLVGEANGFGSAGGVANFFISNGKVRFELNPEAARSRGLKLDAKLLSLGTEIRKTP